MSNHDCPSAVGKRGSKKAGPEHDIGACVSLTPAIIVTQVYHPSSLAHKAPHVNSQHWQLWSSEEVTQVLCVISVMLGTSYMPDICSKGNPISDLGSVFLT